MAWGRAGVRRCSQQRLKGKSVPTRLVTNPVCRQRESTGDRWAGRSARSASGPPVCLESGSELAPASFSAQVREARLLSDT